MYLENRIQKMIKYQKKIRDIRGKQKTAFSVEERSVLPTEKRSSMFLKKEKI